MDNLFTESPAEIERIMVEDFQNLSGQVLIDADARRMIIKATALGIILAGNRLNVAVRNQHLKYCDELTLDLFAEDKGVEKRRAAQKAVTTIRFTRIGNLTNAQAIPYGTRVANGQLVFIVTETKSFEIGANTVDIKAECFSEGSFGNGYAPGILKTLLDSIPYVSEAINITTTNGGSDLEELEAYRERIRIAPESYSCAGTRGAYEFWAKTADSSISDVYAYMDSPGTVGIRVLLEGGIIPSQEVLDRIYTVVASDDVRALTDNVVLKTPTSSDYTMDFDYYIPKSLESFSLSIQTKVTEVCDKFAYENRNKLGISINPEELSSRLRAIGVKRTVIRTPIYVKLEKTHIANCTSITPVFKGVEDD